MREPWVCSPAPQRRTVIPSFVIYLFSLIIFYVWTSVTVPLLVVPRVANATVWQYLNSCCHLNQELGLFFQLLFLVYLGAVSPTKGTPYLIKQYIQHDREKK